jgi:hypothetical protein
VIRVRVLELWRDVLGGDACFTRREGAWWSQNPEERLAAAFQSHGLFVNLCR